MGSKKCKRRRSRRQLNHGQRIIAYSEIIFHDGYVIKCILLCDLYVYIIFSGVVVNVELTN
jgi:hypothetical protein